MYHIFFFNLECLLGHKSFYTCVYMSQFIMKILYWCTCFFITYTKNISRRILK